MIKKVIIALVVIGAIGGAYGYFFMYNKSHPDYEKLDADISISAAELFANCRDNGQAATYTGKVLEITGTAQSLEKNAGVYTLVFVFDDGVFGAEGVRATFLPNYNTRLEGLSLDQEIKIKAFCTGYNDSDVILEKASLIN